MVPSRTVHGLKPHTCSYKILTTVKSFPASAVQLPLKATSMAKEIKATMCQGMFSFQACLNPKSQESLGKVQRMSILEVTTLKKDLFPRYSLRSSVEYGRFWDVLRLWLLFVTILVCRGCKVLLITSYLTAGIKQQQKKRQIVWNKCIKGGMRLSLSCLHFRLSNYSQISPLRLQLLVQWYYLHFSMSNKGV